ncbi:general stress protein [Corynebacterium cystitidis]|uniref:general stress protein n=1 Tax=Corynebacterium cystitidis TaxID=35757 RepID=UPI00211E5358|nr:general stress protein [Corynebacterium cystitidis]
MTMNQNARQLRQRPAGWPVGSFNTYAEAQAAVDHLSDREFPVEDLAIVGVDLMEVEKITGRLTWGRVLGGGALAGAFWGLFFALFWIILSVGFWIPLLTGIIMGAIFGLIFAAISYGATGGARDFSSHTQIIAGRYDVLCASQRAAEARDIIAGMQGAAPQANQPAPGVDEPRTDETR